MGRTITLQLALFTFTSAAAAAATPSAYHIDDSAGPARPFHGIGGLSGGGATSVLLPSYPEPQRSTILDLLFKPNYGAALQILKVEIGGDAQSTDGAESSHMHDPWATPDFTRGYEWFLMKEAKARNPEIKLYGLPWAFPQWVSCAPGTLHDCTGNAYDRPQQTADYITSWVRGAKEVHGLDIDYLGCWNERAYNKSYMEVLRRTLDSAGYRNTKLIANDNDFPSVAKDVNSDPAFAAALWGLGAHYPNMVSGPDAEKTGMPLWASEEDSTYNNAVGAGCWARVLNQNFVRGNMSASINWNLIAAYQKGTNWWRAGLMTAFQPWSGAFGSLAMIWATAHTTQFTRVGNFSYLANGTGPGTGSGLLALGGSYVTLQDFGTGEFTVVIEKMSRDHSPCCRPALADFSVATETATFTLTGAPAKVASLYLWRTHWAFGAPGDATTEFEQQPAVPVVGGKFTLTLEPDSMYTLTTLPGGAKGAFPASPPVAPFPAAFTDDFESCAPGSEAKFWSDQNGIFECQPPNPSDPAHGVVMRQMVPLVPIAWGGDNRPHTIIGSRDLVDTSFSVDVRLTEPNGSVTLGARLGCPAATKCEYGDYYGALFSFDVAGHWNLTGSTAGVQRSPAQASGALGSPLGVGAWHRFRLDVNGTRASVWVDNMPVPGAQGLNVAFAGSSGFAALGTVQFGHFTEFDNVALYSTATACSAAWPEAGMAVKAVSCASEVGPRPGARFTFLPLNQSECTLGSPCNGVHGAFALVANASLSLCIAVDKGGVGKEWPLVLQPCVTGEPTQVFRQQYAHLYDSKIVHVESGRFVALPAPDVGSPAVVRAQNASGTFVFVGDEAEIVSINEYSVVSGASPPLPPSPPPEPSRHCAHATRAPFPCLGSASGAAEVDSSHRHTCTSHGPSRRRPCQCHLVACGSVAAGVVREQPCGKCGPHSAAKGRGGVTTGEGDGALLRVAPLAARTRPDTSPGACTVAMVHLYSC